MTVIVEGVRIELTHEQIGKIEKERLKRKKCRNSFTKTLLHFGFKQCDSKDDTDFSFEHTSMNWFAVFNEGSGGSVWMVGGGLKNSSSFWKDGCVYWTPDEISKEIIRALDEHK